jgi:hypothetical protein
MAGGPATEMASGATSPAMSEARTFVKSVEDKIRKRPIAAVAVVSALAFVFGAAPRSDSHHSERDVIHAAGTCLRAL